MEKMFCESNEVTATDRIFEIQQELTRITALIDNARIPLELDDDRAPDEILEELTEALEIQMQNLDDVIRDLDQLRLDLLNGTQKVICYTTDED